MEPTKSSITTSAEGRVETRFIDHLQDEDLKLLNELLPWQCFTLDSSGREFGKAASETKRYTPQAIPDRRIVELNKRCPLAGKSVLEIGCFEGIHSIGLAAHGATVTAIDSRIEHVVKTIVRTWSFGLHVTAFKCDVENPKEAAVLPKADVLHHMGVLYHLVDPVAHLNQLLPLIGEMVLLDTHYVKEAKAVNEYESGGVAYRYETYREGGRENAFAGMYDHAKWLTLDAIQSVLAKNGFGDIDVAELREERNGDRTLIFAKRTADRTGTER